MKLKSILLGVFAFFGTLSAQESDSFTGLSFFSFPGEYVGGEKKAIYEDGDGTFTIEGTQNSDVCVRFRNFSNRLCWDLHFAPPQGEELVIGMYEEAERWPFQEEGHPGLTFSGDGRGYNRSVGAFEILELEYDEDGEIIAFAANFVQQGDYYRPGMFSSPLFGSVRYNSSIPVEKTFLLDVHENQKSTDH